MSVTDAIALTISVQILLMIIGCVAPKNQIDDYVDKRSVSRAEKVVKAQFQDLHVQAHADEGAKLSVLQMVAFLNRNQGWLIGSGGLLLGVVGAAWGVLKRGKGHGRAKREK